MKTSLLLLSALIISRFSTAAPVTFIGTEIPPEPPGCKSVEGMLLGELDAFSFDRLLCGAQDIVVLQRFVEMRGKQAYFQVIDELFLPRLVNRQTSFDAQSCRSASHQGEVILAIAESTTTNQSGVLVGKDILHAWRFNLLNGKIEAIATQDVACEVEDLD